MDRLAIVVPCYNEEAALPFFLPEMQKAMDKLLEEEGLSCELLFVDDGSKDGTLELLRSYAKADSRVRYLSFSRNFGKEAALFADDEPDAAVVAADEAQMAADEAQMAADEAQAAADEAIEADFDPEF